MFPEVIENTGREEMEVIGADLISEHAGIYTTGPSAFSRIIVPHKVPIRPRHEFSPPPLGTASRVCGAKRKELLLGKNDQSETKAAHSAASPRRDSKWALVDACGNLDPVKVTTRVIGWHHPSSVFIE
jgi:hypothetical protein